MKTADRSFGGAGAADRFDRWAGGLSDVTTAGEKKAGWITFGVVVAGTFGFWLWRRGKRAEQEKAEVASR